MCGWPSQLPVLSNSGLWLLPHFVAPKPWVAKWGRKNERPHQGRCVVPPRFKCSRTSALHKFSINSVGVSEKEIDPEYKMFMKLSERGYLRRISVSTVSLQTFSDAGVQGLGGFEFAGKVCLWGNWGSDRAREPIHLFLCLWVPSLFKKIYIYILFMHL